MSLMPMNGTMMPPRPYMSRLSQQGRSAHGAIAHAAQRQWDEADDNQRIKITADRMALGGGQTHDVERIKRRVCAGEGRGDDREVLGDIVGNAKRR